jgi:hypothetical protein
MAQLTLKQKNALAENAVFKGRLLQALFSKANYFLLLSSPASNLKEQKQRNYAAEFVKGGSLWVDLHSIARLWLANYNTENPELDEDGQPTDDEILNTIPLDLVYNKLAGVFPGDESVSVY